MTHAHRKGKGAMCGEGVRVRKEILALEGKRRGEGKERDEGRGREAKR
jgi:hypothetical protein